jgi:Asp/Glu/hydantoin racemase
MKTVLGSHLVIALKPEGVKTALDLMTEEGKKNSIHIVKGLREKGIDVLALACTGFTALGIHADLEKASGLPVIDALKAAALFVWYATVKKYA